MNEAETRAEYLDPVLKAAGRGVVEGSRILREYKITPRHGIPEIADAMADLGEPKQIQAVFIRFQKFLHVSAALGDSSTSSAGLNFTRSSSAPGRRPTRIS